MIKNMDKYQIVVVSTKESHAGTKAPEDVTTIAKKLNFEPFYIRLNNSKPGLLNKIRRQFQFLCNWENVYKSAKGDSIILLQHPFYTHQLKRESTLLKLKKKKHVHFICVVHDVDDLRVSDIPRPYKTEKYFRREFELMMQIADVLIVHNTVMRDFFVQRGFDKSRIVVLEIFDYLRSGTNYKLPIYEKSIMIAGNLDSRKSGYISGLPEIACKFYLYGPNYSLGESDNITYGGVLSPEQVPEVLTKGFGLIWDGNTVETCKGGTGEYLKYNNPHKLSLYLSSGLPVIIWKDAAEAKFVCENGVGYTIDALREIPELMERISESDYERISKNVRNISEKLTTGKYMQCALDKAVEIISAKS